MREIVRPLVGAGTDGIDLTGGDGAIRRCYPILAAYAADYPEQCLVTCSRSGRACPVCGAPLDEFGGHICYETRDASETLELLRDAASSTSLAQADAKLKPHGLNFVDHPFWEDLPHCNIHACITPDILHQGYQGVLTHLVGWLRRAVGDAELDARFQRLPPMHGLRQFTNGISCLSRVSAQEHKDMCKQLVGCIIGKVPTAAVRATVALLEFFYLAQYQSHTDVTLGYMETALDEFHKHKKVFLELGVREGMFLSFLFATSFVLVPHRTS